MTIEQYQLLISKVFLASRLQLPLHMKFNRKGFNMTILAILIYTALLTAALVDLVAKGRKGSNMNNDTLITSSGIIRNHSIPRVGIVNASSLYDNLFQDCLNDGIDLTYEEFELSLCDLSEEEAEKAMDSAEFDSHTFLLGAWIKDVDGSYVPDITGKNGSFALVYNTDSNIVSVKWSQFTKECNNTSPCYFMADGSGPCGNLDDEGDAVIAYTLPLDMFRANS